MTQLSQRIDAGYWENWRTFIRQTMRGELFKAQKLAASAVGDVLAEQFKKRDREIADLQARLARLETERAAERAAPGLRAIG
jgi:predicted kinase